MFSPTLIVGICLEVAIAIALHLNGFSPTFIFFVWILTSAPIVLLVAIILTQITKGK